MQINTPTKVKQIEDWDFSFGNGSSISIVIDREEGDTCDFPSNNTIIHLHRVARPSVVNLKETIPAEDFYIPVANVLGIRKQERVIQPLSIEDQEEWQNVLEELTGKTKSQITH